MNGKQIFEISTDGPEATLALGERIGKGLTGGEVIELRGDLGAGKTQLVRGIAKGAGSSASVQSPSFTIMREYACPEFVIKHYDFYRLDEPGLHLEEIIEAVADREVVSVIEWAGAVATALPQDHNIIEISASSPEQRLFRIQTAGLPKELFE